MSEPRPFTLDDLADNGDSPYLDPAEKHAPVFLMKDFPEIIDNTARDQFFLCPQKFLRASIHKIAPRYTSEHLHFGGAFATGLEIMRKRYYDDGESQKHALDHGIISAIEFYGDYIPPEGSF